MERTKAAEGKTKIIWTSPEHGEGLVEIESKDDITAGDGARKDVIGGKGILSTTTTTNCFRLLRDAEIPTHFKRPLNPHTFLALAVEMIPLELVVRRIATGSYLKRRPDVAEGTILPYVVEFFTKDDARHDPLIIYDFVSERILFFDPKKPLAIGLIEEQRMVAARSLLPVVPELKRLALESFQVLETAWAKLDVTLVDLKVECGWHKPAGKMPTLVVADVIDNDSWRIWPKGDRTLMKDKQVYRDLEGRTPEALGEIKKNYAWVAEQTEKFLG